MFSANIKNRFSLFGTVFTVIIAMMLFTTACDDNPAGDDGSEDSSDSIESLEGEIAGYDLGAQELYKNEDFVDLIEGSIDAEGELSVELLDGEAIQEALKPLTDDSDGFVAMYCREAVMEDLDSSHLFVEVGHFNFTYGEDTNVGGIALSSNSVNRNIYPPQGNTKGDYQVRWIYSSSEITISESCGTEEVEVDFSEGWNEVVFDVTDKDAKKMYTGERPSDVDWVMES